MKILRVAPDIYPHMVGGFGIHIHEMSKEQVRLGHDVTVYTPRKALNLLNSGADGIHGLIYSFLGSMIPDKR